EQHRAARAARVREIRRRVAGTGIALFLAAWGVVYTQGSTGVTTASPSTAVAAQVSPASTTTATTAATSTASTSSDSSSSQVAAVTTQQS
ncbi:MAG: hypothetical protein QOJ05_1985, partial [Verrucomicrobiota bacterium]